MRKQWEGLTLPQGKERSTRMTTQCSQIARSTTPRWWKINWSSNLTRSVRGVNPTYHFLSWVLIETFEFFVRTIEIKFFISCFALDKNDSSSLCWTKNLTRLLSIFLFFVNSNMASWTSFHCISSLMKNNVPVPNKFGHRQNKTHIRFVDCLQGHRNCTYNELGTTRHISVDRQ